MTSLSAGCVRPTSAPDRLTGLQRAARPSLGGLTDTTLTRPGRLPFACRGTRHEYGWAVMRAKPTIVRNPANDLAFQEAVEEILHGEWSEPEAVQERLRERYPRAVVRPRELDAERTPVWYVYREGRWTRGD